MNALPAARIISQSWKGMIRMKCSRKLLFSILLLALLNGVVSLIFFTTHSSSAVHLVRLNEPVLTLGMTASGPLGGTVAATVGYAPIYIWPEEIPLSESFVGDASDRSSSTNDPSAPIQPMAASAHAGDIGNSPVWIMVSGIVAVVILAGAGVYLHLKKVE